MKTRIGLLSFLVGVLLLVNGCASIDRNDYSSDEEYRAALARSQEVWAAGAVNLQNYNQQQQQLYQQNQYQQQAIKPISCQSSTYFGTTYTNCR